MFQTKQGLSYDLEFEQTNDITLVLFRPNGRATRITHFKRIPDVLEFLGETCLREVTVELEEAS
jgi:hypothetical protein